MKEIQLTKGKVTLVDDQDFDFLNQWKWRASCEHGLWYARRTALTATGPKYIGMHQVILGYPKGLHGDHRNGNGLDNQRKNLRIATPSQNQCNKRMHPKNTTGFRGVWRRDGRFSSVIKYQGRRYYLPARDTAEQAAQDYDAKARELHGEFARLNFPLEGEAGAYDFEKSFGI
jgi:hypothetical protein